MRVNFVLKNYKCFEDTHPARFSIRRGDTAFVGVNNAGKSTLLRFFYDFRVLFQLLSFPGSLLSSAIIPSQQVIFNSSDPRAMFSNLNDRVMEIEITLEREEGDQIPFPQFVNGVHIIIDRITLQPQIQLNFGEGYLSGAELQRRIANTTNDMWHLNSGILADPKPLCRTMGYIVNSLYVGAFRNVLSVQGGQYYDIVVGREMVSTWNHWKNGLTDQERQSAIKLTGDLERIFGFPRLEINPSADGNTLIIRIGNASYPLLDVGSGFAQFFLVLATAAVKKPAYILIDEPELNLHPSLQVDFLTTLATYASQGVVFSTHNYGLARTADDIYLVSRISSNQSDVKLHETETHLAQFLGELGFSAYRDLGFDKILLVEGPTDVKTIQQFLRLYSKEHQVVLLAMHGSVGITRDAEEALLEVRRIAPDNIFALIDSERTSAGSPLEKNRQGFAAICNTIGVKCHVLERTAIENYFTEQAIQRAIGNSAHALAHFERPGRGARQWTKTQNWQISRYMSRHDLDVTDLGQFLASI